MCDSYQTLPALLAMSLRKPSRRQFFRLLGEAWSSCDNIAHFTEHLDGLLGTASLDDRLAMMTGEERELWHAMPDTIIGFRGCYAHNRAGFSYSLEEEVARWFPFYPRYRHCGTPLLIEARIPKASSIIKLARGESEIIVTNRHDVEIVSTRKIRRPRSSRRKEAK